MFFQLVLIIFCWLYIDFFSSEVVSIPFLKRVFIVYCYDIYFVCQYYYLFGFRCSKHFFNFLGVDLVVFQLHCISILAAIFSLVQLSSVVYVFICFFLCLNSVFHLQSKYCSYFLHRTSTLFYLIYLLFRIIPFIQFLLPIIT